MRTRRATTTKLIASFQGDVDQSFSHQLHTKATSNGIWEFAVVRLVTKFELIDPMWSPIVPPLVGPSIHRTWPSRAKYAIKEIIYHQC